MGAAFISQQFLQNVLGYSTLEAGRGVPARDRVHGAGRAALGQAGGDARRPLHAAVRLRVPAARASPRCCCCGRRASPYWKVGARLRVHRDRRRASPARPPRTRSPARCRCGAPGMASGTADLQRDLGGAIMQSIFGALLTAGYAAAAAAAIAAAPNTAQITDSVENQLTKSFAGRRGRRAAVPAVRDARSPPRPSRRSSTATSGPTRPGSSRSCSARCSCSSCSRRRTPRSNCSPSTTPRTSPRPSGEP